MEEGEEEEEEKEEKVHVYDLSEARIDLMLAKS